VTPVPPLELFRAFLWNISISQITATNAVFMNEDARSAPPPNTEDSSCSPIQATVEEALAMAMNFHRNRQWNEAAHVYQTILEAVPDQVEALNFLGVLLHQAGNTEDGAAMIAKAISLCPDYVDAISNLGNVYRWQGELAKAEEAFRRAAELAPNHPEAYNNLGVILKNQGRYQEAETALRRAIEIAPDRGDAHFNLGNVLDQQQRREEAIAEYQRAIELMPAVIDAYDALARSLYRQGMHSEAGAIYRKLLKHHPGNATAQHMLAALQGEEIPTRASDAYVTDTFDRFAESFDVILKNLGYCAPKLVAKAIEAEGLAPENQLDMLDAGCGTGLCGPLLRPYARQLVGVDLSAEMLKRARQREVYDDLEKTEITAYLRQHRDSFDLIASADTLIYFGDLRDVLFAAAGALRASGYLIFTLEDVSENASDRDYVLEPHGRYSHTEAYVRRVIGEAGLRNCQLRREELRKETGKPVMGMVVFARKGGTNG
jgi:predicted TPR repeat methyltransferase